MYHMLYGIFSNSKSLHLHWCGGHLTIFGHVLYIYSGQVKVRSKEVITSEAEGRASSTENKGKS